MVDSPGGIGTGVGSVVNALNAGVGASGGHGAIGVGVGEMRVTPLGARGGEAEGEETSSREAGTSEGETSSDSTSSAGRRNRCDFLPRLLASGMMH